MARTSTLRLQIDVKPNLQQLQDAQMHDAYNNENMAEDEGIHPAPDADGEMQEPAGQAAVQQCASLW